MMGKQNKARASVLAGTIFGVLMGLGGLVQGGLLQGLFMTLFCGVAFGVAMHFLLKSPYLRKQASLDEMDLLEGEEVLDSAAANLVVNVSDFNLGRFAFDDFLWAGGMRGKESIGGFLHLTNFRLIFKAHRINRLTGKLSILLPTVTAAEDTSYLMVKRLTVSTQAARVGFVVADPSRAAGAILQARDNLSARVAGQLRSLALDRPELFSDGLVASEKINRVNDLLTMGKKVETLSKVITSPIGGLGSIFLAEFVDETIARRWSEQFDEDTSAQA